MTATIEERAAGYDLRCFATVETMPHIMKRITHLARSGRRMTVVSRYLHKGEGHDDRAPDVRVGLVLDPKARSGGVNGWSQSEPEGSGVDVLCSPGLVSWGVAAYARDGSEAKARDLWNLRGSHHAEVTYVEITGGQHKDQFGENDSVAITRYNSDGVGMQTIVRFDTPQSADQFAAEAAVLDRLAARLDKFPGARVDGDAVRHLAGRVRYTWKHVDEVEDHGPAIDAEGHDL